VPQVEEPLELRQADEAHAIWKHITIAMAQWSLADGLSTLKHQNGRIPRQNAPLYRLFWRLHCNYAVLDKTPMLSMLKLLSS
jgi:hypothetical protein